MSKRLKKRKQQFSLKEVMAVLAEAENCLHVQASNINTLRDKYEFPLMIEEVKKLIRPKDLNKVTASWLQRRYKTGYARSARLLDELRKHI